MAGWGCKWFAGDTQQVLVPELKSGDVAAMDNLFSHKRSRTVAGHAIGTE